MMEIFFTILAVGFATSFFIYKKRVELAYWLMKHCILNFLKPTHWENKNYQKDEHGLRVRLAGTSGPNITGDFANQSSTMFHANNEAIVVDLGTGSMSSHARGTIPFTRTKALFITHFHDDHLGDLADFQINSWILGRTWPLHVYGGPGIEEIVKGCNQMNERIGRGRTLHHGPELFDQSILKMIPIVIKPGQTVQMESGMKVTAFKVVHNPCDEALGYKIQFKDRTIVMSGDTAPNDEIMKHTSCVSYGLPTTENDIIHNSNPFACVVINKKIEKTLENKTESNEVVDILIHEATTPRFFTLLNETIRNNRKSTGVENSRICKLFDDVLNDALIHTETKDVFKLAEKSKPQLLIFSHVMPYPINFIAKILHSEHSYLTSVPYVFAHDGLEYFLPIDSKEIIKVHSGKLKPSIF